MKIKLTHSVIYDLDDPEFREDFETRQYGNELTFEALNEYVMDRFINPNFDLAGTTKIEIVSEVENESEY